MRSILLPIVFLMSGCYKMSYSTGPAPGKADKQLTHHTFVYGIIEPNPINLNEICPQGFAKISHKVTVVNYLMGAGVQLLASLTAVGAPVKWYTPHNVSVYCYESNPNLTPPAELKESTPEPMNMEDAIDQDIDEAVKTMEEDIQKSEEESLKKDMKN